MSLLLSEPVLYAPQNVTIESLRADRDCEKLLVAAAAAATAATAEVAATPAGRPIRLPVDYPVLPLLNRDERRLQEVATYSMATNRPLDCRWHHYVRQLPDAVAEESAPKMPRLDDYRFRCNLTRYLGNAPAREVRMKLRFIPTPKEGGKMTPSPTAPKLLPHRTQPAAYMRRQSKPFVGLKRMKSVCCPW